MEEKPTAKDIRRIVWKIRLRKLFPSKTGFADKTLWDWLGLLIIPIVLGFGALLFNQAMRTNEQNIAENQQREEALQNYFDKVTELLLQDELLDKKGEPADPVVDVAQVRTVTTLRLLDLERKNILFQFLRDSNLADFILVEASLAEADLSNADIHDINLSGADLLEANLSEANLSGANLSEANLSGANLRGADLSEANLNRAELFLSDLSEANLREADLSRAFLFGSDLIGADLIGANLSEANLIGANLRGAVLIGANLSEADLIGADLREANLRDADLSRAYLGVIPSRDYPVVANLMRTTLRNLVSRGADLSEADLSGADLSGADLSGATLTDANLSRAIYNNQTQWPEGFDYENSGAILDE